MALYSYRVKLNVICASRYTHITVIFTCGYQMAKFMKIPIFLISIISYYSNINKRTVFNVRQSVGRYWKYWLRYELKREDIFNDQKSAITVTFTQYGYRLAKFTKILSFLLSIISYYGNIHEKPVFTMRYGVRRYCKYRLRYQLKREDTFSNQ